MAELSLNRQRLVVFTACLAAFMTLLDAYIVNVAAPSIARELGVDSGQISRIIIAYLLMITSTLLFFGKLADRRGIRPVLAAGYAVFTLGSLFCGLSPTLTALVLARGLQGLGGAMMGATMYSVITRFLPVERQGRALGALTLFTALGIGAGAPVGGLIVSYASWHWIFFINVPVGLGALVIVQFALPKEKPVAESESLDLPGVALSFLAISCLLVALNLGPDDGWTTGPVLGLFAGAVICGAAFIRRESRAASPLLELSALGRPRFSAALTANFFSFMLMTGGNFLVSFYLALGKGLGPREAGFVLLIFSGLLAVAGPLAGRVIDRLGPRLPAVGATLLSVVNCFFFAATLSRPGLVPVMLYLALLGLSAGFLIPAINYLAVRQAPAGNQGSISGLLRLTVNLGQVTGVCVLEAVFDAATPGETAGAGLHLTAPAALMDGFHTAFLVSGALGVIALALAVVASRRMPAGGGVGPAAAMVEA